MILARSHEQIYGSGDDGELAAGYLDFYHKPVKTSRRKLTQYKRRSTAAARQKWEQACRQRWRALALAIKAKPEVVESGIATFEEEFLAYVVMPDGATVGQHVLPNVETAYATGRMPPLLPAIGGTGEGK